MQFETQRLLVRSPVESDGIDIYNEYTTDNEVTKYLCWKTHTSPTESVDWIKSCILRNDGIKAVVFSVINKESKSCIGMIDVKIDGFKCNFGYVLSKQHWNKGIMTEAMKPVINYLIKDRPDIIRIFATHDIENPASGIVMQKLGMQYEGTLRSYIIHPNISNKPRDSKMYSIVKQ